MSTHDHQPSDTDHDEADTATFQQFVDAGESRPSDDGRTFRMISLLAGVGILVVVMYLLLFA